MPRTVSQYRQVKAVFQQKHQSSYQAFREALRIVIPYDWRRRAVNFVRGRFGTRVFMDWTRAQFSNGHAAPPKKALRLGDFYEGVTLLPHIPETDVEAILSNPICATNKARPDIICFSIVDWSFRFQRPQQLMAQFAAQGHRVFYLSISQFLSPLAQPKFAVRELRENLFEVQIAATSALRIYEAVVEGKNLELAIASLDELRRACYINEAIGYVMIPSWGKAALATQQRWGWRVIYDCMDEWENFPGVNARSIETERDLAKNCDLLVVTAQRLYDKWRASQSNIILARNAADYQFLDKSIASNLKKAITPASIIIVAYNNLALTKLCLESVFRNTDYPNYEVIVVDNKSTDGTEKYLQSLAEERDNLVAILNDTNNGFAKANNQGIEASKGDYLVLLNNDTIVPQGWLSRLLLHLCDPQVGLVGPVTNFVGNEAKIDVSYRTWAEMEAFAQEYVWGHDQQVADIYMLAMFCVAMRREVFEKVGRLDEQFGIGMFEDDDYSTRIKKCGYRTICAADSFVHHFGQAAFGKLIRSGDYDRLFNGNRGKYEQKWGVDWTPHKNDRLNFEAHILIGNRDFDGA